jgi:hypothetical protein
MITPVLIQVIFWLTSAAVAIGLLAGAAQQGGAAVLVALIMIPIAILMIRVYCEVLIVLFRIYDTLVEIRSGGTGGSYGFPVQPPAAPYGNYPPPPNPYQQR